MKMISAVIKPFKLDDVREALSEIGVSAAKTLGAKHSNVAPINFWDIIISGNKVNKAY